MEKKEGHNGMTIRRKLRQRTGEKKVRRGKKRRSVSRRGMQIKTSYKIQ